MSPAIAGDEPVDDEALSTAQTLIVQVSFLDDHIVQLYRELNVIYPRMIITYI